MKTKYISTWYPLHALSFNYDDNGACALLYFGVLLPIV